MVTLLVIVWVLLVAALPLVLAVRLRHGHRSWFELKRLDDTHHLRRERLLENVGALRRLLIVHLVILITALATAVWGAWGALIAVVVFLSATLASRVRAVRRFMDRTYHTYESKILDHSEKAPLLKRLGDEVQFLPSEHRLESSEQLVHLATSSRDILSHDQKNLISSGIDWHTTRVDTVMTAREAIVTVGEHEILGPLVLDDLHRSGHTRFPVIGQQPDKVSGILDVSEFMEITTEKATPAVVTVMNRRVVTVRPGETLKDVLRTFAKTHQSIAIVVDEDENMIGLVTLAQVTQPLVAS